jgi:hypothetical protein
VTLDIVEPAPQRLAQVLAATRLASDLAAEYDPVVFDLAALRHFHPGGWRSPFAAGDESILNHISLRVSPASAAGRFHPATTGLCKFGRPEFQCGASGRSWCRRRATSCSNWRSTSPKVRS